MKKITNVLHFLVIIIFLNSCASTHSPATTIANKSYIGMPINEFKSLAGKKTSLEAMESGYTVYKMNDYDVYGVITDTKFFYFDSNAKLIKIDGGEFKQKRYQLEIINK